MNTSSIELNMPYKYPKLCAMFGEDVKLNNAKKAQLKRWSRYFSSRKGEKATIIITEIYDVVLDKVDGRSNNGNNKNSHGNATGRYAVLIDEIMKNHFNYIYLLNGTNAIYTTVKTLALKSGVITNTYNKACKNPQSFLNEMSEVISEEQVVSICINNIASNSKDKIKTSLDRLNKTNNCLCEYGHILVWNGEPNGTKTCNEELRLAKEDEEKILKQIKEEVLIELGIDSIYENRALTWKYYNRIDQLACVRIKRCSYLFKGYKIQVFEPFYDGEYIDTLDMDKKVGELSKESTLNNMERARKKAFEKASGLGTSQHITPMGLNKPSQINYYDYIKMTDDFVSDCEKVICELFRK